MAAEGAGVAGLLLTGGRSRRMGFDKALMRVAGQSVGLAGNLAGRLAAVAGPVVEVGPGFTNLTSVREEPPGAGPLAALCRGAAQLETLGWSGPVVVVACDMPFVTTAVLGMLASWPGDASVVPVVGGIAQPLCARWSASDLISAHSLVSAGERSMKALVGRANPVRVTPSQWPAGVEEGMFADVDTPLDAARSGVVLPPQH